MAVTIIRSDEPGRNKRLRQLGLVLPSFKDPRHGLLEAVRAAVAGRAGATANDVRSMAGFNAWGFPIRRAREVYRGNGGWEAFEENGVEGIIHHQLKIKITAVSTDKGTCDPDTSPRNRTPKGPATESVTDLNNQITLFEIKEKVTTSDGYQLWELCIFDDGNDVRAELSLPVQFGSGHFIKFAERIFLIDPGEWKKIAIDAPDLGDEIEPEVRRK